MSKVDSCCAASEEGTYIVEGSRTTLCVEEPLLYGIVGCVKNTLGEDGAGDLYWL